MAKVIVEQNFNKKYLELGCVLLCAHILLVSCEAAWTTGCILTSYTEFSKMVSISSTMTKPILLFKLKQAANYKTKKCNKSNCKVFPWITRKPPAFTKTYKCYENTYLEVNGIKAKQ